MECEISSKHRRLPPPTRKPSGANCCGGSQCAYRLPLRMDTGGTPREFIKRQAAGTSGQLVEDLPAFLFFAQCSPTPTHSSFQLNCKSRFPAFLEHPKGSAGFPGRSEARSECSLSPLTSLDLKQANSTGCCQYDEDAVFRLLAPLTHAFDLREWQSVPREQPPEQGGGLWPREYLQVRADRLEFLVFHPRIRVYRLQIAVSESPDCSWRLCPLGLLWGREDRIVAQNVSPRSESGCRCTLLFQDLIHVLVCGFTSFACSESSS